MHVIPPRLPAFAVSALFSLSALPLPRTPPPCAQEAGEVRRIGGPPLFVLMWLSPAPFVYETLYGGADESPAGRQAVRLNTKAQALALGKNLAKSNPAITYSLYKLDGGDMLLQSSFPKTVNVEGARVKFRRRRPRTGGSNDETLLGVGGMGDDVWRELLEKDAMGELDVAWSKFRRELELGRDLEVVDERGDQIDVGGDYEDEDDID